MIFLYFLTGIKRRASLVCKQRGSPRLVTGVRQSPWDPCILKVEGHSSPSFCCESGWGGAEAVPVWHGYLPQAYAPID